MTYDIVFVAGLLSFFSPCIIPLLPVYIAQLAKGTVETVAAPTNTFNWRLILQTIVFVIGISTNFVLLGFGAGFLGQVVSGEKFLVICGFVVVVLGLYKMGLIRLDFLARERKLRLTSTPRSGVVGSYLLGFTFSFGWTPCIGPVLASVLGIASNQGGQEVQGALLMLIYSAGLAVPFVVISFMGNALLNRMKGLNHERSVDCFDGDITDDKSFKSFSDHIK